MKVEALREACRARWEKILAHPYVLELGNGTLDEEQLRRFIAQDYRYLKDFSLALRLASVKAVDSRLQRLFLAHAQSVYVVERDLHERIAPQLQLSLIDLESAPMLAVTRAYTNHVVRVGYTGTLAELVAALLPCYSTYLEIGQMLYARGLPEHPVMREWIVTYQGDAYRTAVEEMMDVAQELEVTDAEWRACQCAYHWSMVYEEGFWDQAYQPNLNDG